MTDARTFYGWKLVVALAVIVSVNMGMAFLGTGVVIAPMAKDLGLSRGTLGLGSTVFALAVGLGAPLVARVIHAIGARRTLCIGSLLTASGSLLLAVWVGLGWQFVFAFGLLMGLGCAFGALIPAQTCASTWFERRRALALALVLTGSGIGGSLAAPSLSRLIVVMDGNWRAAWYVVFGAALLAGLVAFLFVKDRPGDVGQLPDGGVRVARVRSGDRAPSAASVHRTQERWTVRQAVRTPAFWLISIAVVGESAPATAALAHAVPHLRDLGHAAQAAGTAVGLFATCTIAGKLSVGFLCDRIEPRYVWSACILTMGLALVIGTQAYSATAMYLFTGLLGFGSGAALTCWHATVANYFGPSAFPSILGAQMPFSTAVAAVSPFFVGLIYDMQSSYTTGFYIIAALSAVSAMLLLAAVPPRDAALLVAESGQARQLAAQRSIDAPACMQSISLKKDGIQ